MIDLQRFKPLARSDCVIGGWQMELRHLRYFVAVAEELNFTRAARKLRINQPPLSTQIRQLEKELGTQLFRRLTRGVELTDAGKLLLEQARIILKQVEDATLGVRRRGRGETGCVIVGISEAYFHPQIMRILRETKTRYPNLTIATEVALSNTLLLVAWLRTGRIDACVLSIPIEDSEGIAIEPIVDEDCVMVLQHDHPLANAASAPLASLAKEKFVLFHRTFSPATYDSIFLACRGAGFVPKLEQEVPTMLSIIPLVAAGFGVAILPRSFSNIQFAGVKYVDIEEDAPRSAIALACRRDERSPAIKNVMKAARIAKLSS
jgi:DNA-binding transcriptional LysR family regulator